MLKVTKESGEDFEKHGCWAWKTGNPTRDELPSYTIMMHKA
jgi:hypothetical protein